MCLSPELACGRALRVRTSFFTAHVRSRLRSLADGRQGKDKASLTNTAEWDFDADHEFAHCCR
jgi:hypothetical protein